MSYISVFKRLIAVYPKDHQFRFSNEMALAFEVSASEHLRFGKKAFARFVFEEFTALVFGAATEWIAKWTTDVSVRSRYLPDLRMMPLPWVPQEARRRCLGSERCSPDTSQ